MTLSELLICPKCKDRLIKTCNTVTCNTCGVEYKFENEIYDFLGDAPYYWSELTGQESDEFLETARLKGWKDAVRAISTKHREFDEYVMSKGRSDWLFHCVDFARTNTCLDIGSGWGAISFSLSSYFDEVWSLEAVKQRIDFQRIRQEQENIKNIHFVRSDWLRLPFQDNYFDVVCANGVLEWVGLSDYSKNPRDLQIEFLKELQRVLKPDGCLYIGVENRFGFGSFIGNIDHSGLRFTGILPRKISDIIVKLSSASGKYRQHSEMGKWPDYRTYTYSLRGYRDLLKEGDFNQVNSYWTTSYNNPKFAGKLDDDSVFYFLKFLSSHKGIATNFPSIVITAITLLPKKIVKLLTSAFVPELLIFAYKGKRENTFENKLLQLGSPSSSFFRLSGSLSLESKISYFLFKQSKCYSILKFPRGIESTALDLEEERMSQFNSFAIQKKMVDSVPIFIEPVLTGDQILLSSPSQNLLALNWLLNFQNKTQKGFWDQNLLGIKINHLIDFLQNTEIERQLIVRTRTRIEEYLKSLADIKIPITSEHGDFCYVNIIIDKAKAYVVDWEFYEEYGDPFYDFIFFILTSSCSGTSRNSAIKNLNCQGEYSSTLLTLISMFSKSKNIAPEIIVKAIPMVIIKRLFRIQHSSERHINNDNLLFLLGEWDKIADNATSRILSRLQIHR
jgi:ubiquinone/menaquinone biosynthesis C-methylase UbiE